MDSITIAAHIDQKGNKQTIEEHCKNVGNYASVEAKSVHLSNTLYLAGLLHDVGKNTTLFEQYINDAHEGKKLKRGEVNHSSAGGRYIIEVADKDKWQKLLSEVIAYVIFSHHGMIDMLSVQGDDMFEKRRSPTKDIRYTEAIENSKGWIKEDEINLLVEKASDEIQTVFKKIDEISDKISKADAEENEKESKKIKQKSKRFFMDYTERLILSFLIDADRRDTAEFMSGREDIRVSKAECCQKWNEYLTKLREVLESYPADTKISKYRKELSDQCALFAENGDGIYRLSIPTGGGKTLSGMRYALELAKRTNKKHIYYVAPFLSILEQNANIYRNIFQDDKCILEHHSNVIRETQSGEDLDEAELLEENWDAPIILTTMVQFMNTLFLGKTSSVRRLHQLKDSVIIIDEAQAIPVKCTYMFAMAMNFLHYFCNTTVVLCTATQPLFDKIKFPILFSKGGEIIDNAEYYWNSFKRVEVVNCTFPKMDTVKVADFCEEILEDNLLVILNTKKAVQMLYEVLNKRFTDDIAVIQLTTYMCAAHRMDVVNWLKERIKNERIVCVSTQLIEAGVDVSFSKVVRSITGIDSIAQAAGRCNRNGEQNIGTTYIIDAQDEKTDQLTDITKSKEATRQVLDYFEGDLLSQEATNMYYKQYFWNRKAEMNYSCETNYGESDILSLLTVDEKAFSGYKGKKQKVPHFLYHSFATAGKLFCMIEEGNTLGVIVPYKEAEEYLEMLQHTYDPYEKRNILKKLQRYTVNMFLTDSKMRELEEMNAIYKEETTDIYIVAKPYYNETGITSEPEIESLIF